MMKSALLGFLIVVSLYQVATLWFDNVSDRNVFYSLIKDTANKIFEPRLENEKEYMIKPETMGAYLALSDKDFTVVPRSNPSNKKILSASTVVIEKALKEGKEEEAEEASFIWQKRGFCFELPMEMSKEQLKSDFKLNSSAIKLLNSTTMIGIVPIADEDKKILIYMMDKETNKLIVYRTDKKGIAEEVRLLEAELNGLEKTEKGAYISTLKNDISLFANPVLILLPSNNVNYFEKIKLSLPFLDKEGKVFLEEELENYVDKFFKNPNVKWSVQNKDVMIYGDDASLVKYSKQGLIEYTAIQSTEVINPNLSGDYNVAYSFLMNDKIMQNEDFYLKDYKTEKTKTIFNFSYGYDGYPLCLDNELLKANNMIYPVEITVENGKVLKYRRLLFEMELQNRQYSFKGQFERVLNEFLENNKVAERELEDMYLGYSFKDKEGTLKWIIRTRDQKFDMEIH